MFDDGVTEEFKSRVQMVLAQEKEKKKQHEWLRQQHGRDKTWQGDNAVPRFGKGASECDFRRQLARIGLEQLRCRRDVATATRSRGPLPIPQSNGFMIHEGLLCLSALCLPAGSGNWNDGSHRLSGCRWPTTARRRVECKNPKSCEVSAPIFKIGRAARRKLLSSFVFLQGS